MENKQQENKPKSKEVKEKIAELRETLLQSTENNSISDRKALEISKKLDEIILEYTKKKLK